MKFATRYTLSQLVMSGLTFAFMSAPAHAVDADAAKAILKSNNCGKCHAVDKEKDGPAYKKTAEKYKGKADAIDKLTKHLTSGAKVKFPDGSQEEHKIMKATPEEMKNAVEYILAQ